MTKYRLLQCILNEQKGLSLSETTKETQKVGLQHSSYYQRALPLSPAIKIVTSKGPLLKIITASGGHFSLETGARQFFETWGS